MGYGLALALTAALASASAHATDTRATRALDDFLRNSEASQTQRYNALLSLGRAGQYTRVMNCLSQADIETPKGVPGASARQIDALAASFRRDMTGFILGSAARYPAACSGAAHTVNSAAARAVRGGVTEDDRIRFADTVVVARAVGGPPTDSADGYRSSAYFVVDESIKGGLRKGSRFALRQTSGPDGAGGLVGFGRSVFTKPGQLYLVLASRGMYALTVAEQKKRLPASDRATPGLIAFGGVLPMASNHQAKAPWGTVDISKVRESVRRHDAGR